MNDFNLLRSHLRADEAKLYRRLRHWSQVLRIASSLAWRTYLANLILTVLLFGQQQPGTLAAQMQSSLAIAALWTHRTVFRHSGYSAVDWSRHGMAPVSFSRPCK